MAGLVKRFLWILNTFFIIFLTGCAGPRYHTVVVGDQPAPIARSSQERLPVFDWPLQGRIVSAYGTKEGGITLKGMVLEGSQGQEVRSAERGQVVFVDESLRGYGKTIIVDHADGYSTVYARNSQILVQAGDRVQKGQVIARVGREGKGDLPQMYFEVRQNSRPLNPQKVLK